MKILIIGGSNSRNAGGIHVTALETGKKLITNHEINIQYLYHKDEYSSSDEKRYPNNVLNTYKILGPSNLGFSFNIYKKIKQIKPDLIHSQSLWMFLSLVINIYSKLRKVPVVISSHGMLDSYQLATSRIKKKIILMLYETNNIKSASCIHALNMLEYASIRELGFKNPIAVIPNGIDLPKENYNPPAPKWKDESKKTLLFLSRIDPKKNIHGLLEAWLKSNYKLTNWELVIAGDLKNKEYINSLKSISGENKTIKFVGGQFDDEKGSAFFHSDAFILPSFSEGLPMAVLEAWSYKKPVFISEPCNLQEAYDCKAAYKIGTDVESIVQSLNTLFETNENELRETGLNGYSLVGSKFTWDKVAENMDELYKWILAQNAIPSFVHLN